MCVCVCVCVCVCALVSMCTCVFLSGFYLSLGVTPLKSLQRDFRGKHVLLLHQKSIEIVEFRSMEKFRRFVTRSPNLF